jgi:hypothetical protein
MVAARRAINDVHESKEHPAPIHAHLCNPITPHDGSLSIPTAAAVGRYRTACHIGAAPMRIKIFAAILLSCCVAAGPRPASAQTSPTRLPESVRLADVEMRWQSDGGDGCAKVGGCSHYRITLSGDGFVELEELPWGPTRPKPEIRRRSIVPDQIVMFVNEFLKARFLEASDHYSHVAVAIRTGDVLTFGSYGGIGAGSVDLTLRFGAVQKTVRLGETTPVELRNLSDLIWRTSGPESWGPR